MTGLPLATGGLEPDEPEPRCKALPCTPCAPCEWPVVAEVETPDDTTVVVVGALAEPCCPTFSGAMPATDRPGCTALACGLEATPVDPWPPCPFEAPAPRPARDGRAACRSLAEGAVGRGRRVSAGGPLGDCSPPPRGTSCTGSSPSPARISSPNQTRNRLVTIRPSQRIRRWRRPLGSCSTAVLPVTGPCPRKSVVRRLSMAAGGVAIESVCRQERKRVQADEGTRTLDLLHGKQTL